MNPWWLLLPALASFVIGSVASYNDNIRNSQWFTPVFMTCAAAGGALWIWAVRNLPNKNEIYFYSLCWDALLLGAYYLLPVILHDFGFKPWTIFGVVLIALGIVIVKVTS